MLEGRIGRVIQVGKGWRRITLTDDEEAQVLDGLRKRNLRVFQQCLRDAEEVAKDKADSMNIAIALFHHLGLGAYTAMDEALEARSHELKEKHGVRADYLDEAMKALEKKGKKEKGSKK